MAVDKGGRWLLVTRRPISIQVAPHTEFSLCCITCQIRLMLYHTPGLVDLVPHARFGWCCTTSRIWSILYNTLNGQRLEETCSNIHGHQSMEQKTWLEEFQLTTSKSLTTFFCCFWYHTQTWSYVLLNSELWERVCASKSTEVLRSWTPCWSKL